MVGPGQADRWDINGTVAWIDILFVAKQNNKIDNQKITKKRTASI